MIVEPRHSRLVTPEEIKGLMEVCFAAGQPCLVVITGSSMTPFLVPGRDRVFLRPAPPALRRGDIAFYERAPGRLVLHRVYRASPQGYYFVGDAQTAIEGPIRRDQILAVAAEAERKGRPQRPGCFWWWFFRTVWLRLVPARRAIMTAYAKLKTQ